MKRHGDLFHAICSFENLAQADADAYRGKRFRPAPAVFQFDLERNLLRCREELASGSYRPGRYHAFWIQDPKPRLISAAPYRDRVVQHALCRVIEPIFERTFVFDSYANRRGKGTHRALDRCTQFAGSTGYVLKCDIAKFFPSIDHEVLMELLRHKIKCQRTLALLDTIISSSNPQEPVQNYFPGDTLFTPLDRPHGIPIGNLTSQFFGNVVLNPLDHWLSEQMGCHRYVRYADDMLVFGDDKARLHALLLEIRSYLERYRLALQPRKCVVLPVRAGIPFLGWQVFPDHRRLKRSTGVRFQRRLKELAAGYRDGAVEPGEIRAALASYAGHLKHGDAWGLRQKLLDGAVFVRSSGDGPT